MRKSLAILIIAVLAATAVPAFAELQNVLVGGSIKIRSSFISNEAVGDSATARNPLFQGPHTNSFKGVPGGNPLAGLRWAAQPGRPAISSPFALIDTNHSNWFTEQRTRLNVRADFTEQVSAFIEFDAYTIWGDNFRSDYLTGVDRRGASDVDLYQAYIESNETFGIPLRIRTGRQEITLGSGWLVGTNDKGAFFRGLSFDAVRATYADDMFSVDAFAAKLAERSPMEADGDVDLYGVYASFLGVENMTFDAYWLLVRDAISRTTTNLGWFGEQVEDILGVDDYDVTNLHTVGLRGAGTYGAFDFEAEAAYQFGNASAVGATFSGAGLASPYGDEEAEFGKYGANGQVGFTFDIDYNPRVYVGGAYFGGEDNRALNFGQWLGAIACPFWHQKASVSFNRLFSNWEYSTILDNSNADLSNAWLAYGGVSGSPLENVKVDLKATYFQALEDYKTTWPIWTIWGHRILPLYPFSFVDQSTSKHIGVEATGTVTYNYSEDLSFQAGYSHLFARGGLSRGNFNLLNGLGFDGGASYNQETDYIWVETKLAF
jgi:hypothetical protein